MPDEQHDEKHNEKHDPEHEPYSLEPEETPRETPEEGKRGSKDRSLKAKIESPGLLSDFPEDADFDRDPEVDRVIAGTTATPVRQAEGAGRASEREEGSGEPFVHAGFPDAKVLAIAGAVLLVSAMVATGVNAETRVVARVLLTLYNTLLHTGTGVVALFVVALLSDRRLGAFELAAARMFVAVGAFSLIFNLNINFIGEGWEGWKGEELVLAGGAYLLVVASLFRLWDWRLLLQVIAAHFFLWLVVYVGMMLAAFVQAA